MKHAFRRQWNAWHTVKATIKHNVSSLVWLCMLHVNSYIVKPSVLSDCLCFDRWHSLIFAVIFTHTEAHTHKHTHRARIYTIYNPLYNNQPVTTPGSHHVIGQYNLYFLHEKLYRTVLEKRPLQAVLDKFETRLYAPTPCDQRIGRLQSSSGGAIESVNVRNAIKTWKDDKSH